MSHFEPNKGNLFRLEALNATRSNFAGSVILSYPISVWIISGFAILCLISILVFSCVGEYTARVTVQGQLIPTSGILRVYSPQPAVVLERAIAEGQFVRKGDKLFVLSSDRKNRDSSGVQAEIGKHISSRRTSLTVQYSKTISTQQTELESARAKVGSLRAQASAMRSQIEGQQQRVDISGDAMRRYAELRRGEFISTDQMQQKESDYLDQRSRIDALRREMSAIQQELRIAMADLDSLPAKHQAALGQIERSISEADQQRIENEARTELTITAPVSGTVTSVVVANGQFVDSSRALVGILPEKAVLQADLYAPSRAIGFVKENDAVLLRYNAYPYQKFGHYRGRVLSITATPMTATELSGIAGGIPAMDATKPTELYYRLTVSLEKQTVGAYGRSIPLKSGMTLEADIMQETRRLYEWVLEPVYSAKGMLSN